MKIRKLDKRVEHKGTICSVELVEIDGLIAEINLWSTSKNLYASPLMMASDPQMLVIKDSSKNQGIADALVDTGIVKMVLVKDDVRFCSLLV